MRIGIDGTCFANQRGFGRFTRALTRAMLSHCGHDEIVIVIDEATAAAAELPPTAEIVTTTTSRAAVSAAAAGSGRSLRDLMAASRSARSAKLDVMFFPASYSYFPVPGVPEVVTVHDAIAELLPQHIVPYRADRWRWTIKQRVAMHRAKAIVTVSSSARDQVMAKLPIDPRRLLVITEAADPCFSRGTVDPAVLARHKLIERRYAIYVGGASPHKNLPSLIRAFDGFAASAPPELDDVKLVLSGEFKKDPFYSGAAALARAIDASASRNRIVLTGYVPDDELASLYRGARATVLPSLSEGFGLPAVESIACGTPVIASDIPAFREVLGVSGLFAAPDDPHAFTQHLMRLFSDEELWNRQAALSEARARDFDWNVSARTLLSALRSTQR